MQQLNSIEKLLKSPYLEDVALGVAIAKEECGKEFFMSEMSEDVGGNWRSPYLFCLDKQHEERSGLIKINDYGIIVHVFEGCLFFHTYKSEFKKIHAPKYSFFTVIEI